MIGMAAALFGDEIDKLAFENRSSLLMAVQHQMFCKLSGAVLDIRTAVMATVVLGESRGAAVYDSKAWDEFYPGLREQCTKLGATIEIIDGREFTARGEYRKAVRARLEAERAQPAAPAVEPVNLTGQ